MSDVEGLESFIKTSFFSMDIKANSIFNYSTRVQYFCHEYVIELDGNSNRIAFLAWLCGRYYIQPWLVQMKG